MGQYKVANIKINETDTKIYLNGHMATVFIQRVTQF